MPKLESKVQAIVEFLDGKKPKQPAEMTLAELVMDMRKHPEKYKEKK